MEFHWRGSSFNGEQSWTYSVDGETLAVIDYPDFSENKPRRVTLWDKGQMIARRTIDFSREWKVDEIKRVVMAALQEV